MRKAMQEALWLNVDEALALGLIDEIAEEKEPAGITDHMRARIVAHGLPIPHINAPSTKTDKNFLHKLEQQLEKVLTFLTSEGEDPTPASSSTNEPDPSLQKSNTMETQFTALNKILAIEGLTPTENGFVLSAEHLEKLEKALQTSEETTAALTEAQATIQTLETEKGTITAELEKLKKADGADTPEARPENEEDTYGAASARNSYEKIKGII